MQKSVFIGLFVIMIGAGCVSSKVDQPSGVKSSPFAAALVAKEKSVWDAYQRRDTAALSELISEDSYSVEDADGEIITRAQALRTLPDLVVTEYAMENPEVIRINSTAAVVRYKVKVKGSFKGEAFTPHWARVSSVWVKRNGKWQNFLYQETEIKHHH